MSKSYKWEAQEYDDPEAGALIVDTDDNEIAQIFSGETQKTAIERAAFIVRAVNSFEENQAKIARLEAAHNPLWAALKDAVQELNNIYSHVQANGGFEITIGMWKRLRVMEQALALAEGK